MTESGARALNVVCLASYFKGNEFLRECRRMGARVFLITKEKLLREEWARESLDELLALPDESSTELFIEATSHLASQIKIDRIIALEEYDVITAGLIREHLCLPGMTATAARRFRDKLSMRLRAQAAGILVPEFVHALNHVEVDQYTKRVPPPWVLKPRSDVSAVGIRKMNRAEEVWRALDELAARERLRERPSYYLLERFIPGDVYHVDSIVEAGRAVFAGANRYGRPPMDVAHQGGVFISYTIEHGSPEQQELFEINQKLVQSLGLERGATHAEFIRAAEDGRFYFLEIAARIGGAYIPEILEASTGLNLWREWARLELSEDERGYTPQPTREEYGGIVLSLARQEWPDTSAYADTEIFYRVGKRHHVGLVVRSPDFNRVQELLDQYARRFDEDFSAVLPPLERTE
ncbi:MAG TPA: ATP-grasp domain-containing protein [Pyrinomonadaceae bacterium]|jgi:biotin carboxylase